MPVVAVAAACDGPTSQAHLHEPEPSHATHHYNNKSSHALTYRESCSLVDSVYPTMTFFALLTPLPHNLHALPTSQNQNQTKAQMYRHFQIKSAKMSAARAQYTSASDCGGNREGERGEPGAEEKRGQQRFCLTTSGA